MLSSGTRYTNLHSIMVPIDTKGFTPLYRPCSGTETRLGVGVTRGDVGMGIGRFYRIFCPRVVIRMCGPKWYDVGPIVERTGSYHRRHAPGDIVSVRRIELVTWKVQIHSQRSKFTWEILSLRRNIIVSSKTNPTRHHFRA